MRNRNLVVFVILILAVVIVSSGVWYFSLRRSNVDSSISVEAYERCKGHMLRIMDDPESARFDPYDEENVRVDIENHIYQVSSIVDAENSAGETISTIFICILEHDVGADDWTLLNLTFSK